MEDLFNNLIPAFRALFAEHATAPFFTVQTFCVALWCLDEYWDYNLFTLFVLVMFECTAVWQRVRTLTDFHSMSNEPHPLQCYRDRKQVKVQTDELLPGDVDSLGECLHSLKVVFILIRSLQPVIAVKRIKIPKPLFLPIYCSSVAHVSSMKPC